MFQARNGTVEHNNQTTDYISFGYGEKTIVLLPGVGDGFQTVKGLAIPFAFLYRKLAKDFKVYVFSRPRELKENTTTREMAEYVYDAMRELHIEKASIVGVSQGGMIAQWMAIDDPEIVEKLVLVVTASRSNPTMQKVISNWIDMAHQDDYQGIMMDTAERSYTPKKAKATKLSYQLISWLTKPKSYERFIIQAESCLNHHAYDDLHRIQCPTLIIGGSDDQILTGQASMEMAQVIPNAQLKMYDGLSHGLYEEAKDFLDVVHDFCKEE